MTTAACPVGVRSGRVGAALLAVALAGSLAGALAAQVPDRATLDAYYRALGDHFGLPPVEVLILSEWRLSPEEIPVVLEIAGRGGISPDAVVALRRGDTRWYEIARRYALDAGSFHVRVEGSPGSLSRVYEAFASRPRVQWSAIELSDDEVVGLINLGVLSEVLGVAAPVVLEAYDRAGSWVMAYRALARR